MRGRFRQLVERIPDWPSPRKFGVPNSLLYDTRIGIRGDELPSFPKLQNGGSEQVLQINAGSEGDRLPRRVLPSRRMFAGVSQGESVRGAGTATSELGLWLRAMFEVYYSYGWRSSELPNMRIRLLDFESCTIAIETSKNGDGRTVKMTQKVFELLKACAAGKGENDYVFTRENGMPVKDFRGAWESVTEAAGVPGLLVHDLRRDGAGNLRRAGVDRDTVMRIGGWKTDSVFRRYNIAGFGQEKEAVQQKEAATVTSQNPVRNPGGREPAKPQPSARYCAAMI